jgi:signal transduction histidine kinase
MATKRQTPDDPTLALVADARFHSLAYAIDDAVIVADSTNLVRFANPAADRLLEASPGSLIGQPFRLPLPSLKSGHAVLELPTGRRIEVILTISATVWEGAVATMATVKPAATVTEAGAEAVETLLGAMRARFLAHLSHELRTPLNSVLGFSEALQSELFGPLGHVKYRGYADNIHKAGTRLLGLLTDLLDLSRADSGALELDESLFDVGEVIAGLMMEAKSRARADIATLDSGDIPPLLLRGDKEKLTRALLHLVSNGLAFTPSTGRVQVTADVGAEGQVLIRVADTGRGFSADELARAFQPFPRVKTVEQAEPNTGAGVGLALVRRYIELHGGAVRIESTPGTGTTVTCMLPSSRVALDMAKDKRLTQH